MREPLVFGLRSRGVDVLTAAHANMINRADYKHLVKATELGRVLYSYNVADYCILHKTWQASNLHHCGIIVAKQRLPLGEEIRRLVFLIHQTDAESMRNQLRFLSRI